MTNIVERLRWVVTEERYPYCDIARDAADEIERLRAEITEWRRVSGTSSPEDLLLQMRADGEYED
jgi:hypothetical protein